MREPDWDSRRHSGEFCVQRYLIEDVLDAAEFYPGTVVRSEQLDECLDTMRHERALRLYQIEVDLGVRLLGLVTQVSNPGSETKRRSSVHVDALLAKLHQRLDFGPLLIDLGFQWLEESGQTVNAVIAETGVEAEETKQS